MPTPTTDVTFSSIQTEFGGANPISMSEYVRGGLYVPIGQVTSVTDGVAIPTSASGMRFGMFRGLTKTVPVTAVLPDGMNVSGSYLAPSTQTRSVWINIYNQGQVQGFGHGSISQWLYQWYTPTTAGIGSSYWIRATLASGLAPSTGTALNTWVSLSGGASWTYTTAAGGIYQVRQGTLTLSLSTSATGSPIISTKNATFFVERET